MIKDEARILDQIRNGNSAAYRIVVESYKDLVFSLVLKIIRNREEAEEVSQDVFLKAYHALGSFKFESKFSTWLFRIAYNTAISKTRKKTIINSSIDDNVIQNFSVDTIQENLERTNEEERIRMMNRIISELPEEEQLLINLFYYNRQSVEDISLITGLTDSNVKVKLHRIRKKIYSTMQDQVNKMHVSGY
ncbi:MAG TPA: sigma-70 family RNA polymerase sigma factor [Lentimicrobium sp.]|nr:sigma-70 family RNA polymerase sigma factor [Lentimicrobium sp.]